MAEQPRGPRCLRRHSWRLRRHNWRLILATAAVLTMLIVGCAGGSSTSRDAASGNGAEAVPTSSSLTSPDLASPVSAPPAASSSSTVVVTTTTVSATDSRSSQRASSSSDTAASPQGKGSMRGIKDHESGVLGIDTQKSSAQDGEATVTEPDVSTDDESFLTLISEGNQTIDIEEIDAAVPGVELVASTTTTAPAATTTASTTVPTATPASPPPKSRPDGEAVYFTFDDGPNPVYTPQVLDILSRYGVRATFFVIGRLVEVYPEIIERIIAEGHTVANHTWNHESLAGLSRAEFDQTVGAAQAALGEHATPCIRPPYAATDAFTREWSADHGLVLHMWSVSPSDWLQTPAEEMAEYMLKRIRPGSVVLLHDGGGPRTETVKALELTLEQLEEHNFRYEPLCI